MLLSSCELARELCEREIFELVLCVPFMVNRLHETRYTFVTECRASILFSVEIPLF